MAERIDSIYYRVMQNLKDNKFKKIDKTTFKLSNDKILMLRYSKAYKRSSDLLNFWFGFAKDKFEKYLPDKFYILFICGIETQVLVVPANFMKDLLLNVPTASDLNWKINIFKKENEFEIAVTGKPNKKISEYLNNYNLIDPKEIQKILNIDDKEQIESKIVTIEDQIMNLDGVSRNSIHDKLVDMIRQIGEWIRYKSITNYKIRVDSPYVIDVAWLVDDALHIAIEVQIGGNVTEAKDRLIFAKRFGARKCIIVSNPESVDRIKNVFKYEAEIKHWVEIWGLERIYNMYVDGKNFFENFNELNKHQYRDDITEII